MQPIFWQWNGFTISTYAVWMTIGLIAATLVSLAVARQYHLRSAYVLDAILAAVVAGVLAARAGYVIINWAYYQDHAAEILRLWQGGLNWQAGLIGGSIGAWLVARRTQPSVPMTLLDILAIGLPLGIACGWIGSYFSATAYGAELFSGDRVFFLARDLPDAYGLSNPRWPTQIIGAAWALLLFVLMWFTRRKDWAAGTRYWCVIAVYSLGALLIGFTRGDDVPHFYGWRVDQLLDALLVAAGVIGLWRAQRLGKHSMAEQSHG
jgi:phosphatidylglycerol:prolipoprotein diacylglycerol transferase